jgi:arabinofuranosyltransferase
MKLCDPWIEPDGARLTARVLWVLVAGAAAWHSASLACMADDAYVSFRYARNLVAGSGLVYNPGERVEGYTNLLWVMLVAGGLKLGLHAELVATLLGAGALVATFAATTALARRVVGDGGWRLALAGALLAAMGPVLLWALAGLETGLFTALVVAGALHALRAPERLRAMLASGALFGLATLARPDAVVLAVAFGAAGCAALRGESAWRRRGAAALLFAVGFAPIVLPWFAWRVRYYDAWPPNSFHAKATSAGLATLGAMYARGFVLEYPALFGATIAGVFAAAVGPEWKATRRTVLPITGALAGWSAYVVAVGGDYMALYRFFAPVLPFAAVVTLALAAPWLARGARPWHQAAAALLPLSVAAACVRPSLASLGDEVRTRSVEPVSQQRARVAAWALAGRSLASILPRDATIAVSNCGALPYYADLFTIDQSGLCDRHTALESSDPWVLDYAGHRLQATRSYLDRRQPDFVLGRPTLAEAPRRPPGEPPSPAYGACCLVLPGYPASGGSWMLLCGWARREAVVRWPAASWIDPERAESSPVSARLAESRAEH